MFKKNPFFDTPMEKRKEKNIQNKNLLFGVLVVLIVVAVAWHVLPEQQGETDEQPGETEIESSVRSSQDTEEDVVAKVNGEELTTKEVKQIQDSFSQQGQQIPEEDALDQAVSQKVLSQEAEEKYSVTDEEANTLVESQLAQQDVSLDEYKGQMEAQGVSYEEELENIKGQIAIQNYLENELEEETLDVSDEESKEFYETYKEQSPEDTPSYEEIEPQIVATLQQQKQQEAIGSLVEELKAEANIKYF